MLRDNWSIAFVSRALPFVAWDKTSSSSEMKRVNVDAYTNIIIVSHLEPET